MPSIQMSRPTLKGPIFNSFSSLQASRRARKVLPQTSNLLLKSHPVARQAIQKKLSSKSLQKPSILQTPMTAPLAALMQALLSKHPGVPVVKDMCSSSSGQMAYLFHIGSERPIEREEDIPDVPRIFIISPSRTIALKGCQYDSRTNCILRRPKRNDRLTCFSFNGLQPLDELPKRSSLKIIRRPNRQASMVSHPQLSQTVAVFSAYPREQASCVVMPQKKKAKSLSQDTAVAFNLTEQEYHSLQVEFNRLAKLSGGGSVDFKLLQKEYGLSDSCILGITRAARLDWADFLKFQSIFVTKRCNYQVLIDYLVKLTGLSEQNRNLEYLQGVLVSLFSELTPLVSDTWAKVVDGLMKMEAATQDLGALKRVLAQSVSLIEMRIFVSQLAIPESQELIQYKMRDVNALSMGKHFDVFKARAGAVGIHGRQRFVSRLSLPFPITSIIKS